MPDRTLTDVYADMFVRKLGGIAERLSSMADAVARAQNDVALVPGPGRPNYATIAANVQHEVLWGLANLSLDGLTQAASDADQARNAENPPAPVDVTKDVAF